MGAARFRIDPALLDRCQLPLDAADQRHCRDLAADLGGLARWVLKPEVLAQAAMAWTGPPHRNFAQAEWLRQRPQLPRATGSCWVVFVADQRQYPLLREAFVVPWRWMKRDSSEPNEAWGDDVPSPMGRVGRGVLQTMHAFKSTGTRSSPTDWVLRLAVDNDPGRYDLRGLTGLQAESGWVSLAAGWLIATRGGIVDTSVWASAAWGEDGLKPVEGLAAKLRVAHEWGAGTLAVAATQVDREGAVAEQARALGIYLEPLPAFTPNPLRSLRPLMNLLAVRPTAPEGQLSADERSAFFQDATAYAYLLRNDLSQPEQSRAFYREVPLPVIVRECRAQVQRQASELLSSRGILLTVYSGSPELIELAGHLFRPRECMILYTEQSNVTAEDRDRVESLLDNCKVHWQRINRDLRPGHLPAEVTAFVDSRGPLPCVVDLTPGTKLMTLALDRTLPSRERGCWRMYVMTEMRGQEIQLGTYEVMFG